ncbi:MAG: rubrerythrin family protein [Clostridiales bacterium]|nr:rubrerythrin family protein [Clostridiales bacterium]
MKLENSKTKENLQTAFLREGGAFCEYTFYAEQAKEDGFEQIYKVFTQFALNEQAHAKIWFKLFHGIAGTKDNLIDSADLEKHERSVMYADFAKTAREEGFEDIATLFDSVAQIEGQHEKRYRALAEQIEAGKIFCAKQQTEWQCANCGHVHTGKTPPEKCPVCSHPKAYFAVMPSQN